MLTAASGDFGTVNGGGGGGGGSELLPWLRVQICNILTIRVFLELAKKIKIASPRLPQVGVNVTSGSIFHIGYGWGSIEARFSHGRSCHTASASAAAHNRPITDAFPPAPCAAPGGRGQEQPGLRQDLRHRRQAAAAR